VRGRFSQFRDALPKLGTPDNQQLVTAATHVVVLVLVDIQSFGNSSCPSWGMGVAGVEHERSSRPRAPDDRHEAAPGALPGAALKHVQTRTETLNTPATGEGDVGDRHGDRHSVRGYGWLPLDLLATTTLGKQSPQVVHRLGVAGVSRSAPPLLRLLVIATHMPQSPQAEHRPGVAGAA
jgi:hypothetical protein